MEIEQVEVEKRYINKEMLVEEKNLNKENKIDIEEEHLYIPPVFTIIITINIIVFIIELFTGALLGRENIINFGALHRQLVVKGEYWRIISSIFLHGGVYHLLSNMLILYTLGMIFEKMYTRKKVIAIYFISGIAGAVLSILMAEGPSVGASGAIFGIIGATGYYLIKNKNFFNDRNKRIGKVLMLAGVVWILNGLPNPFIDNYAHIGGFTAGILSAFILKGRNELEYREYILKNNLVKL